MDKRAQMQFNHGRPSRHLSLISFYRHEFYPRSKTWTHASKCNGTVIGRGDTFLSHFFLTTKSIRVNATRILLLIKNMDKRAQMQCNRGRPSRHFSLISSFICLLCNINLYYSRECYTSFTIVEKRGHARANAMQP